jgi:hypothetical protein
MNEITKPLLIHSKILAVMKEVNAVAKSSKNVAQGFSYRSIDAVMGELHKHMAKHGVFCVPTVIQTTTEKVPTKSGGEQSHTKMDIAYDFYAEDGSSIRSIVRGEAMDSGDKSSNKCLAVALKYALTQIFMIPTSDNKDPDAQSPKAMLKELPKPITGGVINRASNPVPTPNFGRSGNAYRN